MAWPLQYASPVSCSQAHGSFTLTASPGIEGNMSQSHSFRRWNGNRVSQHSGRFTHYTLLLHHSTQMTLPGIVAVLRQLLHFAEAEALSRMWDAYLTGRAEVLTTHFERAEFLAEQFQRKGLPVSLQPRSHAN